VEVYQNKRIVSLIYCILTSNLWIVFDNLDAIPDCLPLLCMWHIQFMQIALAKVEWKFVKKSIQCLPWQFIELTKIKNYL